MLITVSIPLCCCKNKKVQFLKQCLVHKSTMEGVIILVFKVFLGLIYGSKSLYTLAKLVAYCIFPGMHNRDQGFKEKYYFVFYFSSRVRTCRCQNHFTNIVWLRCTVMYKEQRGGHPRHGLTS